MMKDARTENCKKGGCSLVWRLWNGKVYRIWSMVYGLSLSNTTYKKEKFKLLQSGSAISESWVQRV